MFHAGPQRRGEEFLEVVDDSVDTVFDQSAVEVYEQSCFDIGESKVREQLLLMHRQNCFYKL